MAMETLDHRRRKGMASTSDAEAASLEAQGLFETALSQPQAGAGLRPGEVGEGAVVRSVTQVVGLGIGGASPSTMERGMVASPFHSDKI